MSLDLISRVKPTPAAALAKRARALAQAGKDVVNFASGDVDHPAPDVATEAAMRAARRSSVAYTNVDGDPLLKRAIAEDFARRTGKPLSEEQIIVSTGSKQSIYNALYVSAIAGAEVIVPAPYWSSHIDIAVLAGYTPRIVPCGAASGYKLDGALLERSITPQTRWLILTNPSSPVGSVYSASELAELQDVLLRHPQVCVLCDELYEAFVFDDAQHVSMSVVMPELADRILTVGGVSKSYAMMGWRIGWAIGNTEIIARMSTLQSQVTSSPSTIGQAAAAAALTTGEHHRRAVLAHVAHNRNLALSLLGQVPGLRIAPGEGAIYLFLDISSFGMEDRTFSERLLDDSGLVVLPGADCGMSPFLRINIARTHSDLHTGVERLIGFLRK